MKKNTSIVLGAIALLFGGAALLQATHKDPGERAVLRQLNDPDSAQFGQSFRSPRGGDVWCGSVNAKNRMGGYVGMTRYVADTSGYGVGPQVIFEGDSNSDLFPGKWSTYCE